METKTELEQAIEAREQARVHLEKTESLLEECTASLEKSQRFNDLAIRNQRQMIFAMSTLLPRNLQVDIDISADGEELKHVELAEDIAFARKQREVFDIVHAINVLAMANTDVIHIHTEIASHVNEFSVCAVPANQIYQEGVPHVYLMKRTHVYLHEEGSLDQLIKIESQLTGLLIDARYAAESDPEVAA
ncbi:hypothetical protein [Vibrio sp. HN007]|uniref:hypothetical protein n=1 Tax=Vibrio iocasae TaxID=3098914 RepID=UPI0035D41E21